MARRRKLNAAPMLATLAALLILTIGGAARPNSRAQQILEKVEKEIRAVITNPENPKAAEIKVIPYQTEENTLKGHIKTFVIRTSPGKIKHVPVELIDMRADGVTVDLRQLFKENRVTTTRCDRTTFHATVAESNLNTLFANGLRTKDMNLKAHFENGKVRITGNWKLFIIRGPIQAVGKLVLTRKNTLNFDLESLKLNSAEAPQSVKNGLMDRLNPVVEFDELPFRPKVKSLVFKGDRLYASS